MYGAVEIGIPSLGYRTGCTKSGAELTYVSCLKSEPLANILRVRVVYLCHNMNQNSTRDSATRNRG